MTQHLALPLTFCLGLIVGLGYSSLSRRFADWLEYSTTCDTSDLRHPDPRPNTRIDLSLLRANRTLRMPNEPKPRGISGIC